MNEYMITFGQRYRTEVHPMQQWVTPNGYVVIEAETEDQARAEADKLFGVEGWAFIYDQLDIERRRFNPGKHYPLGVLRRFTAAKETDT